MFNLLGALGCLLGANVVNAYHTASSGPSRDDLIKKNAAENAQRLWNLSIAQLYDLYVLLYEKEPFSMKYVSKTNPKTKLCMHYMISEVFPFGPHNNRDAKGGLREPCWLCYEHGRECPSAYNKKQLKDYGYMQDIKTWEMVPMEYAEDDEDQCYYFQDEITKAQEKAKKLDLYKKYFI